MKAWCLPTGNRTVCFAVTLTHKSCRAHARGRGGLKSAAPAFWKPDSPDGSRNRDKPTGGNNRTQGRGAQKRGAYKMETSLLIKYSRSQDRKTVLNDSKAGGAQKLRKCPSWKPHCFTRAENMPLFKCNSNCPMAGPERVHGLAGGRLICGSSTTARIYLKKDAALMLCRSTRQNRPKEGVAKAKRGNKRGNKTHREKVKAPIHAGFQSSFN